MISVYAHLMVFNDPKLDALLAQANAKFDALSPEEKIAYRREQAISFAYGNVSLSNPDVTREMVEEAFDRLAAEGKLSNLVRP